MCLELPIESTDNARYHVDSHDNIWIVTLSMNRIVFVQIYSCSEARLVKEYRYALEGHKLVNSLHRIFREEDCMRVRAVTYGLSQVDIIFCPYSQQGQDPYELAYLKSINVDHEQRSAQHWSVYSTSSGQTRRSELLKLTNYILKWLSLDHQLQIDAEPTVNPLEDIPEHFDILAADSKNHYIVDLARDKA